jgi:hypothetical protein
MIAEGRPFAWMATSANDVTANIALGQTGWQASANTNQSLQISFYEPAQIYVIMLQAAHNGMYLTAVSIYFSDDAFNWLLYTNASGASQYNANGDAASIAYIPLSPAITTRHLKIIPRTFYGTYPSTTIGIRGCALAVATSTLTHTYSGNDIYNLTITTSDGMCDATGITQHVVDVAVTGLSIEPVTTNLISNNGTVQFNVTGTWGQRVNFLVMRSDNVLLTNYSVWTTNVQSCYGYVYFFQNPGYVAL